MDCFLKLTVSKISDARIKQTAVFWVNLFGLLGFILSLTITYALNSKNMNIHKLTSQQSKDVDLIVERLNPDLRVFVVTGAGMSAESGLPTYRGVGGLYNSGEAEQGMTIEELLSGRTYRSQPELTWKYLAEIGRACSDASFNRGHELLAEMESHFADFCILTQNIDGFHLSAGSKNVIEIHGNLHHLRCEHCGHHKQVDHFNDIPIPPYCDMGDCGEMMRPNVVLFDEMLLADACDHMARQWDQGFDIVLSIGTTSVFPYIRQPVEHCARNGKMAVEINPTESKVSRYCEFRLPVSATLALEEIWTRYQR